MISPEFTSAHETSRKEGAFRAILHLVLSGYIPTEEEEAIIAAMPYNVGKRPMETPSDAQMQQARWWNAYCAAKRGRGPKAVNAALALTLPDFCGITEIQARAIIESHRPKIRALAKELLRSDT